MYANARRYQKTKALGTMNGIGREKKTNCIECDTAISSKVQKSFFLSFANEKNVMHE